MVLEALTMTQGELRYAKTWRLRRAITHRNKALDGARRYPTGLSRLTIEGIERDLRLIRAELRRRTDGEKVQSDAETP